MAGTVGGRYELRDEIGSGGMGTVWRAFDVVLDREVAVKRINPRVIGSGEGVREVAKRFQREARVTARILHHGVPQVYDAGLDSGVAFPAVGRQLTVDENTSTFVPYPAVPASP
ncbi:hypothetical protein [Actinoalloteichus sp. AHMU CJ021]|uniref:hypothetical protein n=1 Tax=Actinoalloteichus sp. AHMU CJ021 TaxID=2072503 RepID=UPI00269FF509